MKFVVSRTAKLAVLIFSIFLFQANVSASPICQSALSDSDGDGWGWENNSSCRVESSSHDSAHLNSRGGHPTCSDNAILNGDGWGWENNSSCKVRTVNNSGSHRAYPFCSPNALLNGDGWGWENNASCKEDPNAEDNYEASPIADYPFCSSAALLNGDGWGWENNATCQEDPEADYEDDSESSSTTDHPICSPNAWLNGDGWGWENNASCREDDNDPIDFQDPEEPVYEDPVVNEPVVNEPPSYKRSTPFDSYGRLSVCGTKLCDKNGQVVQLRGMSSHGIHWFPWGTCLNDTSLDMLADDWKTDIYRIAMYVSGGKPQYQQYAFIDDERLNIDEVNKQIEEVSKRGMYVMVDFHVLSENPKQLYTEHAKRFFKAVVAKNRHRENIIYEIANEPTQTTWQELKDYAAEVIPVIRTLDPDAIIVVGTRQWSSFNHGDYLEVVNDPIDADNIMYAFHAYAPDRSHQQKYLDAVINASKSIPVFVTEWGSTEASGQHAHSDLWGQRYVDSMKEHKISWLYWNFSSDTGASSIWKSNYCGETQKDWSDANMKATGHFIKKVFTEQ